jgi:hypothetical protein
VAAAAGDDVPPADTHPVPQRGQGETSGQRQAAQVGPDRHLRWRTDAETPAFSSEAKGAHALTLNIVAGVSDLCRRRPLARRTDGKVLPRAEGQASPGGDAHLWIRQPRLPLRATQKPAPVMSWPERLKEWLTERNIWKQ